MEFWKMNGAGNDFINIQKLKLLLQFSHEVETTLVTPAKK